MDNFVLNRIDFNCDMVKKGKPCSCEPVQDRYVDGSIKIINNFKLRSYVEELSHGWKTVWIYKDEYMLEVIKKLPEQPKTIFDHWTLGKAFGYSDEAIKNFVKTKLLQS